MWAAILAFVGALFWKKNADGSLFKNVSIGEQAFGPLQVVNSSDLDTLARTIWGEARGEGYKGMQAVANVIMNRRRLAAASSSYARQFGRTIAEICKKPKQFSTWNAGDPNRAIMLSVTVTDSNFRDALFIAEAAIRDRLPDITNGADHYHTYAVTPVWSKGETAIAEIGNHQFFKLA